MSKRHYKPRVELISQVLSWLAAILSLFFLFIYFFVASTLNEKCPFLFDTVAKVSLKQTCQLIVFRSPATGSPTALKTPAS